MTGHGLQPGGEETSLPSLRERALRFGGFFVPALILALIVFHPVRRFEFLNFDDPIYLSSNPWLKQGLTWASLQWAFFANLTAPSPQAEYWEPLTLLSRLIDAQIYGIRPGPFHVTSALLHLANSCLLAAALFRLTGSWARSALVALLFLVHPLNVEPVCWLSARKDLLSGTFFFCTLVAYSRYARRQTAARYGVLLAAFCAALMAKPMGVSIPFVLGILDWWPLGRWRKASRRRAEQWGLLAEKIPLLMLAAGGALLAVVSQQDIGAVQPAGALPLFVRAENAVVSYAVYVRRIFWPHDLAIYYPHPGFGILRSHAMAAALFLLSVTLCAWLLRRRAPFFLAGWLWFGIVLGPVIGLVQIGGQAMADRYAYPSVIGIFIALVWGAAELLRAHRPVSPYILVAAVVAALSAGAIRQVLYWRDSITAFSRAVDVTENNGLAYLDLGTAQLAAGRLPEARASYLKCAEIMPLVPILWLDLGTVELELGHEDAALEDYVYAVKLRPTYAKGLLAIARVLIGRGRIDEAVPLLLQVVRLQPAEAEPYCTLGGLYAGQGQWDQAARIWQIYLQYHPGDSAARDALRRAQAAAR